MARKIGNGLDLASQKIINLADPTNPQDASTKAYVDATINGMDWKASVRAATTAAGTLASSFANGQTIDGVTLATGNRILVKDQAAGAENGIYTVNASGAPTRATDADASAEVTAGMVVPVEEGTANGDKAFILTTNGAITLGTTAIAFTQLPGSAGGSFYQTVQNAGSGLTQRATLNASTGLTATDNSGSSRTDLTIDTAVVVRKYAADIGDGSTTAITVTHNLGTKDVTVSVWDNTTPFNEILPDVGHTTTNTLTITFAVAPTSAQYRVVVHA